MKKLQKIIEERLISFNGRKGELRNQGLRKKLVVELVTKLRNRGEFNNQTKNTGAYKCLKLLR